MWPSDELEGLICDWTVIKEADGRSLCSCQFDVEEYTTAFEDEVDCNSLSSSGSALQITVRNESSMRNISWGGREHGINKINNHTCWWISWRWRSLIGLLSTWSMIKGRESILVFVNTFFFRVQGAVFDYTCCWSRVWKDPSITICSDTIRIQVEFIHCFEQRINSNAGCGACANRKLWNQQTMRRVV